MARHISPQLHHVAGASPIAPQPPALRTTGDARHLELALTRSGLGPVAGVDEAGRGACFGPMVVAACILPAQPIAALAGLTDSKKLTVARREALFPIIQQVALATAIITISASDIDRWGVGAMNISGMRRAVQALEVAPGYVLSDALRIDGLPQPHIPIISGDSMSRCIAAASVLAKVTRDHLVEQLDARYPGYGVAGHKGYGTAAHTEALRRLGPSPQHRRSYKNVQRAESIFLSSRVVAGPGEEKVL